MISEIILWHLRPSQYAETRRGRYVPRLPYVSQHEIRHRLVAGREDSVVLFNTVGALKYLELLEN